MICVLVKSAAQLIVWDLQTRCRLASTTQTGTLQLYKTALPQCSGITGLLRHHTQRSGVLYWPNMLLAECLCHAQLAICRQGFSRLESCCVVSPPHLLTTAQLYGLIDWRLRYAEHTLLLQDTKSHKNRNVKRLLFYQVLITYLASLHSAVHEQVKPVRFATSVCPDEQHSKPDGCQTAQACLLLLLPYHPVNKEQYLSFHLAISTSRTGA